MVKNAATADLTALADDLRKAGKAAGPAMDTWMQGLGRQIESLMKQLAPVRTGRLRNSIRMTATPGRVQIGPVDVDYDIFQEYGTGTRGEFGQARVTRIRRGGQTVTIVASGNRPHPFARPAFQQVMNKELPHAADVGVQLVVGGPNT